MQMPQSIVRYSGFSKAFLFSKRNTVSRYGRKGNLICDHEGKCGFPFADLTEIVRSQQD